MRAAASFRRPPVHEITRMTPVLRIVSGLMVLTSAVSASAREDEQIVKAEVLADVSAVKPGATFTVGVLLNIQPGWHVYWTNPGDSGVATKVNVHAPKGFKVGDVRFPVPFKFDQFEGVVGYGYEERVLLTAEVTAPQDLPSSASVKIEADVSWLVCKKVCLPGDAKLSLILPVSSDAGKANERVFKAWSDRFPREKDAAIKEMKWTRGDTVTLAVEWMKSPGKVELYPGADEAIEVHKVDVATKGNATRVTVKAGVIPGQKPEREKLPSLLVYTDAEGKRHGVNVAVPLTATAAAP
jgi:thiol:disulfide interchange protein DsbD